MDHTSSQYLSQQIKKYIRAEKKKPYLDIALKILGRKDWISDCQFRKIRPHNNSSEFHGRIEWKNFRFQFESRMEI